MIRFATIGTNFITDDFIRSAKQVEDFHLAAIYSRAEETAKQFAAKHGVTQFFTDINELAQSDSIDAVYIASPNSLHAEQAILFLRNGKHVLCEKPLASNAQEVGLMIEEAKKNNVLLMEALKTTFLPTMKAVKDNLGKIGKTRRYFSSYCQYSSRYDAYKEGKNPNTFNPAFSNGALRDLGVYCLYPAIYLFGVPKKINANAILLKSGVDGEGSMIMKYDEMEALIMYSKITNSSLKTEIQGEDGSIIIDNINHPEKIEIHYRNGTTEDITPSQNKDTMIYEVQEFIELLKQGRLESSINSHQLSLEVMAIMDEARLQVEGN